MRNHQAQILDALLKADGRYVSGNDLAKTFQISRPAVYNNIQKLARCGHLINTRKGLGYCYQKSQFFNADVINHYRTTTFPVGIHTFRTVSSTNDYAKQFSNNQDLTDPQVFVADSQTRGHGRLGRHFYSPINGGIYLSILIPLQNRKTIHSGLITTGTAVCVVRTLKQFFPKEDFRVKWVNDILVHDKKCGGILTETISSLEDGLHEDVVVGIGLNVDSTNFPKQIAHKAGAIVANTSIDKNQIAASIIDHFFYMYQTYTSGNFLTEYSKLSDTLGKQVEVVMGNQTITGLADHFTHDGALVVKEPTGQLVTVSSGEVTKVYLPGNGYQG
ncbi:biotin--[acetyl-CoA-carboxylase] ligase [Lentilactobacillus otakiensis]|uniref:Bifunctional ligase/repressor BirA n=1 Tax=Lentilactobacillus otakiensis DSM 19908 = JCM 15040 TaxID=1423780 RepID=S4NCZ9_9LACO|nr:biotin--[acetyl-CoA-carboxylase] ligase [Lentilactobacillus otakiensis]KRL09695.1 biotin--acetyl-CoA-carboxylase ligase [Lentilactobacillus otakiensis DSM 19908 = JCM 15040]MBZ3777768.1 biotin--[acetyl-CoA-carboxylase] ligase [Lentilactobacillus otakiensis]MDV3518333.1 biotin--[acetyl-CoA-carboxylase] ligase [Lentilactobacillus otakiensis]GAD16719.1 birA family transcriptional regulator, biotin operon repressor / biotin-[acetyl-CoA-carboxylase] ligase [Lentilactobacillus otakiensis DSM 19908